MANPLLLDIILYLQNRNIVSGDGVDSFRDFSPASPDNVVVLTEYAGSAAIRFATVTNRSVQVSTRNVKANDARIKAQQIYQALYSESQLVHFTDERWGQVYLRQTPFKLSVDEKGRTTYAFNIGVTTTID